MVPRPAAEARVRAALAVAKRIANADDLLGIRARARLIELGDLSREGVELALSEHLETTATEAEIASFVGRAEEAAHCAVILSANVCTAALRALAFGLATAPLVRVKASRRDPVLAELLAGELPSVELVYTLADATANLHLGDELHAYGSDATLTALAPHAAELGLTLKGHGTGFGLAVIEADDPVEGSALALARAIVPFDGRGCLSPRLAFVAGDAARGHAFAVSLNASLERAGQDVPRGPLSDEERAELRLFLRTSELIGEIWEGPNHLIALDASAEAVTPAPAHRGISVVSASSADISRLLTPWRAFVTAIGSQKRGGPLACAASRVAPFARTSTLAAMQRPPFDGPVDLRRLDGQLTGTNTRSR